MLEITARAHVHDFICVHAAALKVSSFSTATTPLHMFLDCQKPVCQQRKSFLLRLHPVRPVFSVWIPSCTRDIWCESALWQIWQLAPSIPLRSVLLGSFLTALYLLWVCFSAPLCYEQVSNVGHFRNPSAFSSLLCSPCVCAYVLRMRFFIIPLLNDFNALAIIWNQHITCKLHTCVSGKPCGTHESTSFDEFPVEKLIPRRHCKPR